MSDFTPGPWLLRTTPTSAGLCHIVSAADLRIAFIYGDLIRKGVDDELPKAQELTANARPITAAPDLLESLRCACNYIDKLGGTSSTYRALLARATGEQP